MAEIEQHLHKGMTDVAELLKTFISLSYDWHDLYRLSADSFSTTIMKNRLASFMRKAYFLGKELTKTESWKKEPDIMDN